MSTVGAVCAGLASVAGLVVLGLLGFILVERFRPGPASSTDDVDPERTRRVPSEWPREAVAEKHRRREAAARVAANFPPPAVAASAPYVAAGRAGRVERQRTTVVLVAGRPR